MVFVNSESDTAESERYSIGLTEWEEWLGMRVAQSTIDAYSASQIVAHCLWEMTWYGADLEAIRSARQQIRESLNEIAKGKGRPFEEFMAELEADGNGPGDHGTNFGDAVEEVLTRNKELYKRLSK